MTQQIKRRLTWNWTPVESYELADGSVVKMSAAEAEQRQWVAPTPVVQDRAYWLSQYPDGNFPLGIDDPMLAD